MDRRLLLQRLTAAACLGMLALLVLLQFVLTPAREAPTVLFVIFVALWAFGATMVFLSPRFGALGTALWGLISAVGAFRMHRAGPEDAALIGGSIVAMVLAAAYAWEMFRR